VKTPSQKVLTVKANPPKTGTHFNFAARRTEETFPKPELPDPSHQIADPLIAWSYEDANALDDVIRAVYTLKEVQVVFLRNTRYTVLCVTISL